MREYFAPLVSLPVGGASSPSPQGESLSRSRREFLDVAAAGMAMRILASSKSAHADSALRVKAIAFGAFPVFDPRPVFALAEGLFPGKGAELSTAWRPITNANSRARQAQFNRIHYASIYGD